MAATAGKKRIIAVFGPTQRKKGPSVPPDILNGARAAGAGVAACHVLLTGGDGPGERSVKDVAIAGAADVGPWVGILGDGPEAKSCGTSMVVRSGLGRKRNFLEALMCDAAIAFAGGEGTRSEVACAFALERPVALVGAEWAQFHDLDGPDGAHVAFCLLNGARELLAGAEEVGDPHFESLLKACLSPARGPDLLEAARGIPDDQRPYRYFDLRTRDTIEDVVKWVAGVPAPEGAPQREFLVETIKPAYEAWLAQVE